VIARPGGSGPFGGRQAHPRRLAVLAVLPEDYQPSISSSPRKSWSSGNVTPEKQRDGWLFFAVIGIDDQPEVFKRQCRSGLEVICICKVARQWENRK
jgi:hypothetical protein